VSDTTIVYAVIGAIVVLFVWNRVAVELVAIGAALALAATGVLDVDEALAGLGDTTVIFIATLFVVSAGLDATGVTTWAGQKLSASVGDSRTRLVTSMMLLVAALTALISVNGAVAALLPMVVVLAIRLGRAPSQLLMPLAFAAHAGSMLALTGTPVNIIVSDAAADAGGDPFGFFEFTIVGVPLLAGTIGIVLLFGERLLPHRLADTLPPDFSQHALTLVRQYDIDDDVHRLLVLPGSPLVGRRRADIDLHGQTDVELVAVQSTNEAEGVDPCGRAPVQAGDILVMRAGAAAIETMAAELALEPGAGPDVPRRAAPLLSRDFGLAEVVVAPRSTLTGSAVFPGMITSSGELVILAVQRNGQDLGPRPTTLATGDTILIQGTWDAIEDNITDPDVLVVDPPDLVRRQAVPFGTGAGRALAILAGMVVLLATGLVPAAVAGLLAATAMVLFRVLDTQQAYRSISWTTVILVGGMIPLSTAMEKTGAAEQLADGLVSLVGGESPYMLLAGLFVLTALLGQLISNTATALVLIPIAASAAAETGVSERPKLMGVGVAAAAAFLTPVATPVNLMIMGPGAYRFGDYWKLGLALMAWFFVVVLGVVPVVWRF